MFGVRNSQDGTNFLSTVSILLTTFLHLLAGYGIWGRGVPPLSSVTSMSSEGPLSFSGVRLGYPNGSNMPTAHSQVAASAS
jgi:hypothetical protein